MLSSQNGADVSAKKCGTSKQVVSGDNCHEVGFQTFSHTKMIKSVNQSNCEVQNHNFLCSIKQNKYDQNGDCQTALKQDHMIRWYEITFMVKINVHILVRVRF